MLHGEVVATRSVFRSEDAAPLSFWHFISSAPARRRARAAAEALARDCRPHEPILGAVICAEEDERYVVRVFVGKRDNPHSERLPPWRECLVFAVPKNSGSPSLLVDDAPYRSTVR
jgi:hypothetical protein